MTKLSTLLLTVALGTISACGGGGSGSALPDSSTTPTVASLFANGYPQGENISFTLVSFEGNLVMDLNSVKGTYSMYLPPGTYDGVTITENRIFSEGSYNSQTGALDGFTYDVGEGEEPIETHENLGDWFAGIYGDGNVALIPGHFDTNPNTVAEWFDPAVIGTNPTSASKMPAAGQVVFSGKAEVSIKDYSQASNLPQFAQGNSTTSVNFDSGVVDVNLSGFNGNLTGLNVDIQDMQVSGNAMTGGTSVVTLPNGTLAPPMEHGDQSGMFFGPNAEQLGGRVFYSANWWELEGVWMGTK